MMGRTSSLLNNSFNVAISASYCSLSPSTPESALVFRPSSCCFSNALSLVKSTSSLTVIRHDGHAILRVQLVDEHFGGFNAGFDIRELTAAVVDNENDRARDVFAVTQRKA